jgi:DNA adenine methylase
MSQNKSLIRWAGGKSWLIPYVQDLIQGLDYNNYFEPFMGSASVFFSLEPKNDSYLSDCNEDLVNAFIEVRDHADDVESFLRQYKTDAESYYQIRALEPTEAAEKAARFLYLNATSFNGLWRVNRLGKYNVPYGHKEVSYNYERLAEFHQKLQGVNINCGDFAEIRSRINKNDLVFLDPPYTVSRKDNGFILYNATLFSLDDQERLCGLIDDIKERGAYYIMTNANHPTIREIFRDHEQPKTLERKSLIGGRKAYRGKVQELIFTNIPERSSENGTN